VDGDNLRIGRFPVEREIGRGAFATVYRARDEEVGRQVAIKLLTTPRDSTDLQRFRDEARHLGQFRHSNIVTVYETGEHAGAPYIVMEYMSGGTILPLVGCGDVARVRAVLNDALAGLAAIHAKGRVHRDLKPQNLLRSEDGEVRIADFGLARILKSSHLTQPGIAPGSPRYMAPEQAEFGSEAGPAADLYALGVIAHELLVGTVPFEDADDEVMLRNRMHRDPPPIGSLASQIDPQLAAWIDWLIRRRPDDRPADADQALRALLERTPPPPPRPTLRKAALHPAPLLLAAAVIAVAAITGTIWLLPLALLGYACLVAIPLLGAQD
jgi:eukaryotic-like serine/threonine-protein kinase